MYKYHMLNYKTSHIRVFIHYVTDLVRSLENYHWIPYRCKGCIGVW